MKLTYWVAKCINDSDVYSIRRKTKKSVLEAIKGNEGCYAEPKQVTVEYRNGFDLMEMCLGEGRGFWE